MAVPVECNEHFEGHSIVHKKKHNLHILLVNRHFITAFFNNRSSMEVFDKNFHLLIIFMDVRTVECDNLTTTICKFLPTFFFFTVCECYELNKIGIRSMRNR